MLKDKLNNQTICLIGFNAVLGKIFVKQLINYFTFEGLLFVVELKSDEAKTEKFKNDSYFGP